jgi:hypothetical protein
MPEVITRDGLATHPGDSVSKHLLASLPYVHAGTGGAHGNRRADYLHGWWPVVSWQEAARRYERCDHFVEQPWDADGGHVLKAAG